MKLAKTYFLLLVTVILFYSCNNKQENKLEPNSKDTTQINPEVSLEIKEEVKFSIDDTIKKSKAYFFSTPESEDFFLLTINPGPIETSTSEFKIVTQKNEVIYKETFRTLYFIKDIYEPSTIPNGSQKDYEEYMEKYRKSLTLNQYKSYFNKSLDSFYEYAVSSQKMTPDELKDWEEQITNKEFENEFLADPTINIVDLVCFDCDEGGKMIGYSKTSNSVKTLLEHD